MDETHVCTGVTPADQLECDCGFYRPVFEPGWPQAASCPRCGKVAVCAVCGDILLVARAR